MKKEIELPKSIDLDDLLNSLRMLSWGAIDILKAYSKGEEPPYGFPKVLKVHDGEDGPVSAADLAVNTWLINGLKSDFPYAPWKVISEETSKSKNITTNYLKSEWTWILDPLDGTKDFLQGTGEYAVHLALIKGGKPLLGVVLIPEMEEMWFGLVGQGAWLEDRLGKQKPFSFSKRNDISKMILVASRSHRDQNLERLIESLPFSEKKIVGSVGCKISKILKGEADFYISLSGKTAPKDWDMAAPEALLLAAGGRFTHANMKDLTYNGDDLSKWGCLIASHGKRHEVLCKLIEEKILLIDPSFMV